MGGTLVNSVAISLCSDLVTCQVSQVLFLKFCCAYSLYLAPC